jgi:hypothetical protein
MTAKSGTSASELNSQATYPGTRFGQNGTAPGQSDASEEAIVSRGTPGGSGNGS